MKSRYLRRGLILAGFLVIATGVLALQGSPSDRLPERVRTVSAAPARVLDEVAPHRDPPPPPPPPPPASPRPKVVRAAPPQPAPVPTGATCGAAGIAKTDAPVLGSKNLDPYRGLGAWIDLYDYCIRGNTDPIASVDELARRGVRTLYLQTSRWKEANDLSHIAKLTLFLDQAALKNISVVGWYLPGFGDLDRDIRRSLAVMNFVTPSGNKFAGFAADIETREEVANDRARFNAGIAEYSRRLRETAPADSVLAGIVVDAKNNERAPWRWEGFPWREIGETYDIVMPMAYWSVSRGYTAPKCLSPEYDTGQYMREVASKTTALMGRDRPMHIIGGIADCVSAGETAAYVNAMKEVGSLGGGLYDYETTQANPSRDQIWSELARLNQ